MSILQHVIKLFFEKLMIEYDLEIQYAHETELSDLNSISATDAYFDELDEDRLIEMLGDILIL